MKTTPRPLFTHALVPALCALAAASALQAQSAPAPTASQLARYDANRNGVLDPSELAAMQADAPRTPGTAAASATMGDDKPIELSPFTVSTDRNQGYFAANTLAGSRMSTNLADLGASISVITKQQMEDTASLDINDVFRYEVNTEGSTTYTPSTATFRNDGPLDVNAGGTQGNSLGVFTNATANRVRGLGVPSAATNYYPTNGQVPFDAYNVASLEISRGPNSMLFGMGSPAGIVNQNTAQAALNRNDANVTLLTDQYGTMRGSLSFNRSLIEDKLAIYGAVLYDDRRFQREPSYDLTRRQYGAITFKPFSKTVLRANVEGYRNDNRRPNTLTPRDYVTQWRLAGEPVYDPLTRMITKQATGETFGPYVINASSPFANQARDFVMSRPGYNAALWNGARTAYNGANIFGEAALTNAAGFIAGSQSSTNPFFVPGIAWTNQPRTIQQIDNGQLVNWFQPLMGQRYRTAWGTATNPAGNADLFPTEASIWANPTWADIYNRGFTASAGWTFLGSDVGNAKYPGVTDSSIYDWENVNILQMNFGRDKNTNFNVELEQQILPNLHLSAGWFRQDFDSFTNYTVAQLNVTTLFVDTNRNLPDGTPNPYFGVPYVEDQDPDRYINSATDDHFRAMLAYTPDFSRQNGWQRWLGRHQILGLASRDESTSTSIRERLNFLNSTTDAGRYRYLANQNNNADGTPTGWSFQGSPLRRMFYLGNPGGPAGRVTDSSGEWDALAFTGPINVYDYASSQFQDVTMSQGFNVHEGGTQRNYRQVDSLSAGMTNYLWEERLITTFGVRKDKYKARVTTAAAVLDDSGTIVSPALTNAQKWVNGIYQTDTVLNRWNRWDRLEGTTRTAGGVLRPFRGWSNIDSRAESGSLFWEFIQDFGISYNESDNFNPPPAAQVDAFGTPLPKPTGEGKDYGFQFSVLDDKLFARVTWFEASNKDERTNPGSSISRLTANVDTTLFRNWARTIAKINMGMDPRLASFNDVLTPAQEDAVRAAAEPIWQQPYLYYDNLPGGIGATRDADAEGIEAEVNYNPTRNWTMKFTFGKQDTVYTNVLKEFDAWYAERYPVWAAARASDYLLPQYQSLTTYTTSGGREVDITNFLDSYGFDTAVTLTDQFGNTNVQNYYNINVQPQYALARDLDGQKAPDQRRYRWSYLTNYRFTEGRFAGWGVGGSVRWEDEAVIGYYGKPTGANTTNPNLMELSDVTRPIYDDANTYTDLWISYTRRMFNDKVRAKFQLNISNVFESGGLQVTDVNYDGSPYSFRIVDPRQFRFSAAFDF